MGPALFRRALNLWPPLLFSGISVTHVAPDFGRIDVCLKDRFYNRTPNRAHFGGSLFAMTDPFYALMLARALGREFTIWDRYASIDFRSPGRGTVTASFVLSKADIDEVRLAAAGGRKVLRDFRVTIIDARGTTVAEVEKTVYIRRRAGKTQPPLSEEAVLDR